MSRASATKTQERITFLHQELRKEDLMEALAQTVRDFNDNPKNSVMVTSVYFDSDRENFSGYFKCKLDPEEDQKEEEREA